MRILLLADLHIGAIEDTDYVYEVLTNIIDQEINFKSTDMVVILGDYFDRALKVSEDYATLALNVMGYLVSACMKNRTKIRIIYGTQSHDADQQNIFGLFNLILTSTDIKVITTVSEEVVDGKKILYMPEEYMFDKLEYYKDTLYNPNKHYDYIFGHGNIKDGMPDNIIFKTASSGKEKQVPLFESTEFKDKASIIAFGHYHCHVDMDNVHYIGSLFRWKFNEDTPKGYGIIDNDKFTFIKNDKAHEFITYEYPEDSLIYNSQDNLIKEVNKIKEINKDILTRKKLGKIRIILHIPDQCNIPVKEILKDVLMNEKLINVTTSVKKFTYYTKDTKEESTEYDFILDNSMKTIDKIQTYISKMYKKDMPLSELTHYIYDPLQL